MQKMYTKLSTDSVIGNPIPEKEHARILSALNTRIPSTIADSILQCDAVSAAVWDIILKSISSKCEALQKKQNKSCLTENGVVNMMNFNWDVIVEEMNSKCPEILDILLAVATTKHCSDEKLEQTVKQRICVTYGILMQSRTKFNSLIQRLTTVILTDGGVSKKCLERMNKMGISLSYSSKWKILETIGGHFDDTLVNEVRKGRTLRATGDNLDMMIRARDVTLEHQNKGVHYFATNMIINRLEFMNLPNDVIKGNVNRLSPGKFIMNQDEIECLRSNYIVLVGRILTEFISSFEFLKAVVPVHIKHRFTAEMAQKSTLVSFPIQFKNENDYGDVVAILRTYEQWIADIYQKAHCDPDFRFSVINAKK